MDDLVRSAFVEAITITLREMAGLDAVHIESHRCRVDEMSAEVRAMIRLQSPARGAMTIALSSATAAALARRILPDAIAPLDEAMINDCVGEVANVIAGQAKSLLFGTPFHFTLSTPMIVAGDPPLPEDIAKRLTVRTELGLITVSVELMPEVCHP